MTTFGVHVEDAAVKTALSKARREIGQQTKQGLLKGAERVLPAVRAAAPQVISEHLAAKGTTSRVYITTTGPVLYDRIAGLLEFGGTVETKLTPVKAQALKIGDTGDIVAAVNTPRHYTGKHRIYEGVRTGLPVAEAVATTEVMASLHRLGL